jgi:formylmethanofuran dehydrogenase subunit E
VLDAPEEALFEVCDVEPRIPARARIFTSLPCDTCGEMTMETRTRRFRGRTLCVPCFQALESRV